MSTPTIAPYGSWKSPITTDLLLSGSVNLSQPRCDGDDLYWLEGRPLERGRNVIVRRAADGTTADVTPPGFSARTRAHEYGGGDYTVHNGVVTFANDDDQRLYRQRPGAAPRPLTPAADLRYADLQVDAARGRLLAIREDHRGPGEAVSTLVAIDLADGETTILAEGYDFYSSPCLSPDGQQLAWLCWNHPNMPWDGTELWLADLAADGRPHNARRVAGGPTESIFQPQWSPPGASDNGRLTFVSDRTGWWNLYQLDEGRDVPAGGRDVPAGGRDVPAGGRDVPAGGRDVPAERLYAMDAEFGLPQWVFGMSTYAFVGPETILCTYTSGGQRLMARLDVGRRDVPAERLPGGGDVPAERLPGGGDVPAERLPGGGDVPAERLYTLDGPLTGAAIATCGEGVVYVGASPTEAAAVVLWRPDGVAVLRRSIDFAVDEGYLSVAEPVEFPTANGLTAHGYFYAPRNRDYAAPPGELPPLIVTSHGGPTSATSDDLSLGRQYWTSRGFAILDVNYGGSTGYGRPYRERLKGNWGIVDVEDCIHGAQWLVETGRVDSKRLIIRGGSAGGYTTLRAITAYRVFQAAASHYGVSDAEALAKETHKFESRYTDSLIGPYPARRDLYVARSPIHVAYDCSAALILFQGLEDKVVPPAQSEAMFLAARSKELPVAYIAFAGEGHGFRQAANIKRAMEAELYFYGRVFDFEPAEQLPPIDIENLP